MAMIVPSGLKTGAAVASDSVIRTKDSGYRSNVHCGGTRDIAAVWLTLLRTISRAL